MPDYTDAKQSSLPDLSEADHFLLRNSSEIRSQLICLSRQPDIITAYFDDGKRYMLTAVLGVINERGLLVLDIGPDDATTQRAIDSGRLVCTAKHDGVPVRFTCENLQSARYKALPAIATPLPNTMYRMQRREFFRVSTPKINGPRCEVADPQGGEPFQLTVTDISVGGAGMLDTSARMQAEPLERFDNCRLLLPEHGEITINIVLRNKAMIPSGSGKPQPRYGVAFEGISVSDNANLQRYIFHLQTQQPK